MRTKTVRGVVDAVLRLPNSRYGNPRYTLVIFGEEYRTQPDSDLAYGVEKFLGKFVELETKMWYGRPAILAIEEVEVPRD